MLCVLQGDCNDYTQYNIFNISKKPELSQIYWIFSTALETEFETVTVNEPSVFEPLKVCLVLHTTDVWFWYHVLHLFIFRFLECCNVCDCNLASVILSCF